MAIIIPAVTYRHPILGYEEHLVLARMRPDVGVARIVALCDDSGLRDWTLFADVTKDASGVSEEGPLGAAEAPVDKTLPNLSEQFEAHGIGLRMGCCMEGRDGTRENFHFNAA